MTVKVSTSASITGSLIKLADLRQLVKACDGMSDDSYVNISVDPADYNQGNYYTISVRQR